MKTSVQFCILLLALTAFGFAVASNPATNPLAEVTSDPGVGEFSITIPTSLEPQIIKQTLDNAVAYKFKKSDGTTQFLFSVNKISFDQWTLVRDQIPTAKLIGEKNGFIYYAETTTRQSMKGADKEAYAAAYAQLDGILKSIKL